MGMFAGVMIGILEMFNHKFLFFGCHGLYPLSVVWSGGYKSG